MCVAILGRVAILRVMLRDSGASPSSYTSGANSVACSVLIAVGIKS